MRLITKKDLPQILSIEKAVNVSPWTEETFAICFQAGYLVWGFEVENKIQGFIIISLKNDECHILNIAVAREYQHQGWGRKLLDFAMEYAKNSRAIVAYLEVRKSNSRAINLYAQMNFLQIGERKDYYQTIAGDEDALIFAKHL